MGGVELEIEQAAGKRHESRLSDQSDDQRQDQPMLEDIGLPVTLAQVAGQRQREKGGRHEFLGPMKEQLRVVGPGQRNR